MTAAAAGFALSGVIQATQALRRVAEHIITLLDKHIAARQSLPGADAIAAARRVYASTITQLSSIKLSRAQ